MGHGLGGFIVFFFQAEDGIRYLVRSRGLGDVYKRQVWDTMPAATRRTGHNVVGVIPGSDPKLKNEVILVMAHFDHLGVRGPGVNGDSIYNGCLLYTSPSPRDRTRSRMPSSA